MAAERDVTSLRRQATTQSAPDATPEPAHPAKNKHPLGYHIPEPPGHPPQVVMAQNRRRPIMRDRLTYTQPSTKDRVVDPFGCTGITQ